MNILKYFTLLAGIITSSAALSQITVIWYFKRGKERISLLILLLNIFILFLLYFLKQSADQNHIKVYTEYSFLLLKGIFTAGLFYTLSAFTHSLIRVAQHLSFLSAVISIILIIVLIFIFPMEILHPGTNYLEKYLRFIKLTIGTLCLYSGIFTWIHKQKIQVSPLLLWIAPAAAFLTITTETFYFPPEMVSETFYTLLLITGSVITFLQGVKELDRDYNLKGMPPSHQENSEKLNQYNLSPREEEVLTFMLRGMNNSDIADRLCVSLSTVKTHTNRIFRKTETANRMELLCKLTQPKEDPL